MIEITSNKLFSPLYAPTIRGEVRPTASYVLTGAWANATGFTFTVPQTGRYKIKFNGAIKVIANATFNSAQLRLYNQTTSVPISNSARGYNIAIGGATSVENTVNAAGVWEENLIGGHVINLQALTNIPGLTVLYYVAGGTELLFSYELVEQVIPVKTISEDYLTTETDTGKNWIDGKRIYRKCFSGTSTATVGESIASGVVPDNVVKLEYIQKTSSNTTLFPGSEHTSGGLDTCCAWWQNGSHASPNTIFLYHSIASVQSRPYFIIMEYTI